MLVLNKIDLVDRKILDEIKEKYSTRYKVLEISARERINLDKLLKLISEELPYTLKTVEYLISYTAQQTVAFLHRNAKVLEEDYRDNGTYVKADVDDEVLNKCKEFEI